MSHFRVVWLVSLVSALGCSSDEPKAPSTEAKSAAPQASGATPGKTPGGAKESTLAWTAPASFEPANNPSPMRLATYKIKPADGDTEGAELSVSQAGGDVTSNVERWKKQFTGEPRSNVEERTVGALKVTVVTVEGTFTGMAMPGGAAAGPKDSWMMLGAIVEGAKGDPHFFKLTGPAKTVESARKAFDELIASFAPR
jgi:hypothetical protein